ncbi:peptide/nickel transport system permease protein [Rhizobiales bacterium GAS191]|nr:peptide/nickel transport system permease protein [Rhizobiales bacterium GAS191]
MTAQVTRGPASRLGRSKATSKLRLIWQNPLAAFGGIVLALVAATMLIAPILPLLPPDATDPADRLIRPFIEGHYLGTDQLGRDILSRLVWGSRLSLAVGLSATLVAAIVGSSIGISAGYFGGLSDNLLMRAIDMLMAFPYVLLALTIVAALGPGLFNALIAVAVVNVPFFARNVRGATLGIVHREFIDAARLSGKGNLSILLSEVAPNIAPVVVVTMSTTVGWMILETAGLSFLGLGSQPPQADLGSMLGEGRKLLLTAPHLSAIPGAVIFLMVMSVNLLGDGIRDALDPRLQTGALARPGPATSISRNPFADTSGHDRGILEVLGLSTEFRAANEVYKAVNSVSFAIRKGECLGLVGESGSGKSVTALSLLALVQSPPGIITNGAVLFNGEDVLSKNASALRLVRGGQVSYIFQDPQSTLHPLFTIGEQIAEAIRAHQPVTHRDAWDKAVRLLDVVRIPNAKQRARSYPHQLSGGMRQRVGIAMALANSPEVLIADEPTTALDVTVQAQVLVLLDELRRQNSTAVLFITHDFGVASEICDRVAVMYAGQIVEMGTSHDVLEHPAHPYTRRLIDCVPVLGSGRHAFDAIRGMPPATNRLPIGCAFADRCDFATAACRAGPISLVEIGGDHVVRCLHSLEAAS